MSQYIAKKAILDTKKECSNRACGCYTEKGYLIKYANRNVDGVLFVCEECFQRKYRTQCTIQNFSMTYENPCQIKSMETDNPKLRCVIRAFNRTIRVAKYVSLGLLITLTILVGILSGGHHLRKVDDLKQNNSIHITQISTERIDKVTERVQYFLTEARSSQ